MASADTERVTRVTQPLLPESLLERICEIPWLAAVDGRLVWIHDAAKNLFGIPASELISHPQLRWDAVHEEDRQRILALWDEFPETPSLEYEYRVVDRGNSVHRVQEIVQLQSSQSGEPVVCGLTRIIGEQPSDKAAFQDTEAVYLSLIESLPLCVLRKDVRGRIQHANAQACEEIGRPIDELIGATDFDLYPADLAKKYMKDDRDVIALGKLYHDVERHQDAQGRQTYVEVWKTPIQNSQGEVVGIQVMFWDVTNQKDTEHQVEFEKFLLATLLETVPDSVYFKDGDSRFIRLSHSCARKFGLDDPQLALGKSDADFFSKDHARKARADERRVMDTGEPILGQIEHETYDGGNETWCSTTKVPLKDKSGRIIGTFGISRDVTEQKRAERELARERDLLKTIINNLPDLIYVKDLAGRFVTANASLLRLLDLNKVDQIVGKTDYDFSPPELACNYVADDQIVMRSGEPMLDREESHRGKDGSLMCLLTTKVPLKNNDGQVIGVVGIGHDITARKKADEEILAAKDLADKASRAKSDFLANVSHEIRTPLNAILGMTDLVLETDLDPSQQNFLAMVHASGESLLSVLNDILDFSKIEAGKLDLEHRLFDIRESLGDTVKTLALKAHGKGLELAFRVAPEVPTHLLGDVARLRQVLVNLVGNAIKFTEKGEVVVEVSLLPSSSNDVLLEFVVRDTGIGIPEEKLESIFHEFEQADTSTTRRFGGTGLGLAISSRLIRLMGGEIGVSSELNGGSIFKFQIVLDSAPVWTDVARERGVVIVGGTRVLVVDDNHTNLKILNEMLSNWGMVPTLAESADLGLSEMRSGIQRDQPFSLVITDVNMPERSGFDFVEQLRAAPDLSNIPVIVLTSGVRDGDEQICDGLKIIERLMKPVKQSELFDAIVRSLGVTVPEDAHEHGEGQQETPSLTRSLRILLAEDNLVNQKLAVGVLSKDGHHVTIVNNGQEAIRAIQKGDFDVVLMDVQMPIMDGLEAASCIRDRERVAGGHLPIIAMTAHAMKGDRERCIAAGMDEYLPKPIRISTLREKLARVYQAMSSASQSGPSQDNASASDQIESGQAVQADDQSDAEPIDWDQARSTVNGDEHLLRDLLGVYGEEALCLMSELSNAFRVNDRRAIQHIAHQLKGASFSIGAVPMGRIAQQIEGIGKSEDMQVHSPLFTQLQNAVDEVVGCVRQYLES